MGPRTQRLVRLVRGALAVLGGLMLLGAGLELVDWASFRLLRYRLVPLYAIARELKKGMPREEVLRIIERHAAPYVSRHDFPDGNVTLWVHYGLVEGCCPGSDVDDWRGQRDRLLPGRACGREVGSLNLRDAKQGTRPSPRRREAAAFAGYPGVRSHDE